MEININKCKKDLFIQRKREVDYLEAREILKQGGTIKRALKHPVGDIIYYMKKSELKCKSEEGLIFTSGGMEFNICEPVANNFQYFVLKEPKRNDMPKIEELIACQDDNGEMLNNVK